MAKKHRDAGLIQVKVRMPIALHRRIERDADRSNQTINGEILRRLESSYTLSKDIEDLKQSQAAIVNDAVAKLTRVFEKATLLTKGKDNG